MHSSHRISVLHLNSSSDAKRTANRVGGEEIMHLTMPLSFSLSPLNDLGSYAVGASCAMLLIPWCLCSRRSYSVSGYASGIAVHSSK